ncbi:hypothetical protein ISF_06120 [Cordyceps fumosorosea ARSEF 2679]|uniref:Protein kinase-like domain protein n=1 Tax=Cordyceps fumosorosea (strain ARSEF 2679) TaxID=1081104 RepID=A0A167T037_CORFA|nr:hypothetical protein ISF_06120 [Cordyceps fumosorosea ARSEF 2679]OAA60109.1 hypothetical protein ISF_06120 [Cordyceps fumosorosea ARSEF 2679]
MMDFRLEQLNSGADGAHVLVSWLGMRFSVSIDVDSPASPPSSSPTPSQRLYHLIRRLQDDALTDDDYDTASQALFSQILAAGEPLLRSIARDRRPASSRLADHLFPPIPLLRLGSSSSSALEVTPSANAYFPSPLRHAHPGAHDLPFAVDPSLPAYRVDQVLVLESLVHDPLAEHLACRVLLLPSPGEQLFCKAERGGIAFGDSVVGRDFRTMLDLRAALLREAPATGGEIRVPALRGVLRHPEEGHVVGFLRDWVPGASLAAREMAAVPAARRARWDAQVASTLKGLHRLGCFWGAADKRSVIVDERGEDAWVVDFGGKVNLGLAREVGDREEGDWIDYDEVCRYLGTGDEEEGKEEGGSDHGSGDGKGGWYAC